MNHVHRRCRGMVAVFVALCLVLLLGIAALAIDIGFFYKRRADAQRAADAAALAGALRLPDQTAALTAARNYATLNGYTNGTGGVRVAGKWNPDGTHTNWYRVEITGPERYFFGGIFGYREKQIGASATAEYTARQPINIWGVGSYGTTGTQSLEISGPYGRYDYGDPYSTRYDDGIGYNPNATYDPSGFNYWMNIPSNYSTINGTTNVWLELYDANSGSTQDEVYTGHGVSTQATTVYAVYAPDSTPNDYTDDVQVATVTIGPNNATYNLKWAVPPGFSFNSATYGTGKYRVNVKTTAGSGGNAYHMRAGPPRVPATNPFNPSNGTSLTSIGKLEMYFLTSGTVNWALGYIPAAAAAMKCHIKKFDTDIGATSLTYTDSTGLINQPGVLSSNGTWKEDVFTIPAGYPGGTLSARYSAGATDTSIWEMWYEGVITGEPGKVRLVM